jgi:membrane protease YdiL (CAAX protease family)
VASHCEECLDYTEPTYARGEYRLGILGFALFAVTFFASIFMLQSFTAALGTGSAGLMQYTSNYVVVFMILVGCFTIAVLFGLKIEVRQFNIVKVVRPLLLGVVVALAIAAVTVPVQAIYGSGLAPPPSYIASVVVSPGYIVLPTLQWPVAEEMARATVFVVANRLLPGDELWMAPLKIIPSSLTFTFGHWWGYTLDASTFAFIFASGIVLASALYLTKDVSVPLIGHIGWNVWALHIAGVI